MLDGDVAFEGFDDAFGASGFGVDPDDEPAVINFPILNFCEEVLIRIRNFPRYFNY